MSDTNSSSHEPDNNVTRDCLFPELWRACAGPLVELPITGERVYYFPQGHLEQFGPSTKGEENQPGLDLPSEILCRILNIHLRAEEDTDDVYAQITLIAEKDQTQPKDFDPYPIEPPRVNVRAFYKALTASDLSSRYGLCIPRKHATECFPPLDMSLATPAQELLAKDFHGEIWQFKHTFRGQPQRHLLTTGWSTFVKSKRLVAGDTVVFLRGEGEIRIGIRRHARPRHSMQAPGISGPSNFKHVACPQNSIQSTEISVNNRHPNVLAVVSHALHVGAPFSVSCYPRINQFIISLKKYLEGLANPFRMDMRIKMTFEGEDCLAKRYTGTIVEIGDICQNTWPNSQWRCFKIQWDGLVSVRRPDRVSPWEIQPFVNLVPKSSVQIGKTQNYNGMPQPVLKKRGKRRLDDKSKEQQVEGLNITVSPHPQSKRPFLEDLHEELDGGCSALGPEKGTGKQIVTIANQMSNSTNQGKDGSEHSRAGLLNANMFQNNGAPISDHNYEDQLEHINNLDNVSHFASNHNTVISEESEAWIARFLCGIDQGEPDPWRETSGHHQPLPENTCHMPLQETLPLACQPGSYNISHASSTSLIPNNAPDPGDELVPWATYLVHQQCILILDRIIARHPETLSSFRATSEVFQTMTLKILAEVVCRLENLKVGTINQDQLDQSKHCLNDLKMTGIQVDWIENRLLQIEAKFKKAALEKELQEVTSIINTHLNDEQSVMDGLI